MRLNLIGKKFGMLKVVKLADKSKWKNPEQSYWECECDCGNTTTRNASNLKFGKNQSCGCYRTQLNKDKILMINKRKKKYNTFEVCNDYCKIFLKNGLYTTIDIEDIDLAKKYYWDINQDGYAYTQIKTSDCISGRRKRVFCIK